LAGMNRVPCVIRKLSPWIRLEERGGEQVEDRLFEIFLRKLLVDDVRLGCGSGIRGRCRLTQGCGPRGVVGISVGLERVVDGMESVF
jgi:hypothetical protein